MNTPQDALKLLRDAAKSVTWFDWSDNDSDAVNSIDDLIVAIDATAPDKIAPAVPDAIATSRKLRVMSLENPSPRDCIDEGADIIDSLCRVLVDLTNQIIKTNPVDDHGHSLQMNRAFLESVKLLDSIAAAPQGEQA